MSLSQRRPYKRIWKQRLHKELRTNSSNILCKEDSSFICCLHASCLVYAYEDSLGEAAAWDRYALIIVIV